MKRVCSIVALFIFAFLKVKAEETIKVQVTGYGYPDNDPPNSAKIAHPGRHKAAGGEGTFDDPITVAAKKGAFPVNTIFYVPHLKRYFVLEDDCASCTDDAWLDVWVGGKGAKEKAVTDCEDCISRKKVDVIKNAQKGHRVKEGPIYDAKCDPDVKCEDDEMKW